VGRISILRKTWTDYIAENPCTIINYVRSTVDNGYGIMIPDITETSVAVTLGVGRVSRRSLPDPYISGSRTPYDYKDVFYLLVSYDTTWLKKGIVFEYGNNKFKTRIPENRIMFGEVVYQLCGLEQVTSGDIGDYSGS
jgi:hypothetical protein